MTVEHFVPPANIRLGYCAITFFVVRDSPPFSTWLDALTGNTALEAAAEVGVEKEKKKEN